MELKTALASIWVVNPDCQGHSKGLMTFQAMVRFDTTLNTSQALNSRFLHGSREMMISH